LGKFYIIEERESTLSNNDQREHGLKFEKSVIGVLEKDGFRTISTSGSGAVDKGVDFLAVKGQCVFGVQVKARPLESFDIISGSTITKSAIQDIIEKNPDYQNMKFVPVLVSGSMVTDSSKSFGNQMGVVVTDWRKVANTLDKVCAEATVGVSLRSSAEVREKKKP